MKTKHKSLHWACNRHLPMVGLPTVTGQAGKQNLVISVTSSGFTPWPQWKRKSFFQDPLHLGLRSRNNDLSYFSGVGFCGNYLKLNGTPALRSFIYLDVGEPTLSLLFNDWDDAGPPPSLLETWSYLGHLFARFALTSWRSTERPEVFCF